MRITHAIARATGRRFGAPSSAPVTLLAVLLLTLSLPAPAAPVVGATKSDALQVDNDSDTNADPGDTLRYTIQIQNSGTTNANNVGLSDTIDANTTLSGVPHVSPLAFKDSYSSLGNVGITVPAASGVLLNDADPDNNVYGWVLPLSLEQPNGIQNDVMAWVWASGGSMMADGQPNLVDNEDVRSAMEFIKGMYDAGLIAPGTFNMREQDKVEEFTNGRVGMMIDSLAHINLIRERNPDLNFAITALPAVEGYDGPRGLPYASWGIGVAENSEHQAEAWRLVEFLMSQEMNSQLSSIANAFPGNVNATPDFVESDELFADAFEVFQTGTLANEFVGLPVAEELMRQYDEQFQLYLEGDLTLDEFLTGAQESWMSNF